MAEVPSYPVEPELNLKLPPTSVQLEQVVHPHHDPLEEDSAITKAEKIGRHAIEDSPEEPPTKRVKLESTELVLELELQEEAQTRTERQKGVAPIKAESVNLDMSLSFLLTLHQISFVFS